MTVYNVNHGVNSRNSGVEHAQAYRSNLLRKINQPAKFIFTNPILDNNISYWGRKIGFENDEIISLLQSFSDVKTSPTVYPIEEFEKTLDGKPEKVENFNDGRRYTYESRGEVIAAHFSKDEPQKINHVDYFVRGNLVKKDYYSYVKYASEYLAPIENKAHPYLRRWFNEDGTTAIEEHLDNEKNTIYRQGANIFYNQESLIEHYFRGLNLTKDDIIIIDRSTDVMPGIMNAKGDAKIGIVIHAEHYSESNTDDEHILWNNYYEYQFENSDEIAFFITSTDAEKEILEKQFAKYMKKDIKIYTVPVGSLDELKRPTEEKPRKPHSLVSVSRLAAEKHVDWVAEAVAIAHKEIPDITLDIWGSGQTYDAVKKVIDKYEADDYIKLKGYANVSDIYQNYEAYLAGSTSEGFGLSLLEAIGGGLPIIGFDVHYGNQTFVDDGKNGYLIPYKQSNNNPELLAQHVIKMFKEADMEKFHEHSYEKASEYLTEKIEKTMENTIKEVLSK